MIRLAILSLCFMSAACGQPGDRSVGAWAGDVRLCADSVLSVRRGADGFTGAPLRTLHLAPNAAEEMREQTRSLVGKPLEISVNGTRLAAPIVAEPLSGDSFSVVSEGTGALADFDTLVRAPC